MLEDALFADAQEVKIITPYKKLRELRGWSQEKAAEIFGVSKRTILEVELGRRDASKQLVRDMDREYGCKGALIAYWLPKFSAACCCSGEQKKPQTFWQRFRAFTRW
jgi:transcriptional regulator with XRE-family HTH domain